MARYYRNEGARFWTADGDEIAEGEVFSADPRSPTVQRRRHKLVPVASIDVPDPLAGVPFGSDTAREAAEERGLTADDFDGVDGSGEGGTYLTSDVRDL